MAGNGEYLPENVAPFVDEATRSAVESFNSDAVLGNLKKLLDANLVKRMLCTKLKTKGEHQSR